VCKIKKIKKRGPSDYGREVTQKVFPLISVYFSRVIYPLITLKESYLIIYNVMRREKYY
jgi:hypothetical protein